MSKEKHSLSSSIIEISSKDEVTKEITMLVHKIDMPNGNGLDFKLEYVEKFKDSIINKPVVAKYYPVKDDLGGHSPIFDANGNIIGLETIAIGSIKESYIDDYQLDSETTVKALFAKAELWNYKYPEIISCIEKLFNEGNADSSVEIESYAYNEGASQEYRYATDYTYLANCLLGKTVIPADSDAGIINIAQQIEIAMAIKKDLENLGQKGDVTVSEEIKFNKGFETKFHNEIETAALKFSQVRDQIYNLLNPIDPKNGYRDYTCWIRDLYTEFVIAEDWNHDEVLWKIGFKIENDVVILDPKENWVKGSLGFIPEGVNPDDLMSTVQSQVVELQSQLDKAKEDLANMSENKSVEVQELETKITDLETKITELNSTIVSQEESKKTLEGQITELNSKVEELTPFKEQVETAQKQAKVTELNSKYSKLLSEDIMKSERVQNALNELNEIELNSVVVEEVSKEKVTTEISSQTDDVIVNVNEKKDLISPSIEDKYGL